jgi:serine/threonine-protein kinase
MRCARAFVFAGLMVVAAVSGAQAGPYGALATSPNADFGYAYNYDDPQDARSRALQECRQHSNECTIKGNFQNVCVSIAKASNGAMGWAWGHGRDGDDSRALQTCRDNNGRGCELATRFCTGNP